jgi:hypothetical protein
MLVTRPRRELGRIRTIDGTEYMDDKPKIEVASDAPISHFGGAEKCQRERAIGNLTGTSSIASVTLEAIPPLSKIALGSGSRSSSTNTTAASSEKKVERHLKSSTTCSIPYDRSRGCSLRILDFGTSMQRVHSYGIRPSSVGRSHAQSENPIPRIRDSQQKYHQDCRGFKAELRVRGEGLAQSRRQETSQ